MLEMKFLGQFEVLRDGKPLVIPSRNAQSLFTYLVLNAGKRFRREMLAGLLWPDSSEDSARSNLRHELWRLRKAMDVADESYFIVDDLTIAFNTHFQYSLDVQRFEQVSVMKSTEENLIEALSIYHGDALPGFYDEWVFVERNRLHALFETKINRLLELYQIGERWTEMLDWAMRWIEVETWSEPAYRALITAYANTGDLTKALASYERLRQGMQKDLGIKPSEQTQTLLKRLKAGWRSVVTSDKPSQELILTKSSTDLPSPDYPLPLLRRSNLPRPLTSFIGREKEIQQVELLVSKARLVTITGSGGVGKTRLAIQVAEVLKSVFTDGTWWVELASLFTSNAPQKQELMQKQAPSDGQYFLIQPTTTGRLMGVDIIAEAVSKVLRLPELTGITLLDGLIEQLRDKNLLLILDNCEHLIQACATLVEELLGECPNLFILATSREALGVPGEKAWRLPSLSLPEQILTQERSDFLQSEAVNLFIERTADITPDYYLEEVDIPAIAQICQRLDGIPLAIELAAARMNMLSAQEIYARLDNRFNLLTGGHRTALPRHQTLRAAIEWSYDLLSEAEKALFRRLSIFNGSFSLEAVENVCIDNEIYRDEVLTLIGRLVDKSLLNVECAAQDLELGTRYRFLNTIQSFGRLKMDEKNEAQLLHDRYAIYYVNLVEAAEPELLSKNMVYWHNLLLAENDNIRTVIEWGSKYDRAESGLRLAGALLWFWFRSGLNREGYDLALKSLSLPSASQFKRAHARALNTAGFLLCLLGDTAMAKRLLDEALSILRVSDDEISLAWTLQFLGLVYTNEKEYDRADIVFQEGIEIIQKHKEKYADSFLFFHGDIDLQKGDRFRAQKRYEECVNIFRANGNTAFLAYPLRRLGYLALEQNDIPGATRHFLESLKFNTENDDKPGKAASLVSMAVLAIHMGDPNMAALFFGVVEKRLELLSINLLNLDQTELRQINNYLRSCLDKATFTTAFTKGWEMSEDQAIELAKKFCQVWLKTLI
jgi:predicted ATPase/DNA-binding SARP family transcriptional activator